jgi:hypothetical protein
MLFRVRFQECPNFAAPPCRLILHIQGVPEVLERFCEAISQEPLGLQKRHRCQKMRLILKFCLKN